MHEDEVTKFVVGPDEAPRLKAAMESGIALAEEPGRSLQFRKFTKTHRLRYIASHTSITNSAASKRRVLIS